MGIDNGNILTKMEREYASKWREIGAALGFSQGEMDNIEAIPLLLQSAPVSWLREMLTRWLHWVPGDERGSTDYPTREALRTAILKANLDQLAEILK